MAKLNFKDLIFKFLQKDEDHDCEKVHPKMKHKEWMNTEPVKTVKENIEVYITKKGSGPVNKRSIVKDFNNKAEAEKWIKWYKTGNMKDVESIYLSIQEDVESIKLNEDYKSDYEKEQPIKVKKAIEIAKRMAGNYTGATKEIEKIAKGLSQLPVVKSVLMRVNEAQDFVKEYLGKSTTRSDPGNMLWYEVEITKGGQYKKISQEELPKWKSKGWKVAFDPSKGKFPKGYFTKESNDMGFWVKFAKKKESGIVAAWYRSKEDAEKALASLKKDGLNGIISKGRMDEEARDLKFGNITVITITKDGKRKEIEKKDLQRWKDDGWKLTEEAPANNASSGNVDMNPTGKKAKLQKKKDDILKRMGVNIKENLDNNNVVLKGVNDTLNTLEDKIDVFSGIKKEEVKLKPKKKTFNEKFLEQLADNTPHTGQFDEKL